MNLAYPIPTFDVMAEAFSQQAAKSALRAGKFDFIGPLQRAALLLAACRRPDVRFHAGVWPKTSVQIHSPTGC